jgi:hypothetical protein
VAVGACVRGARTSKRSRGLAGTTLGHRGAGGWAAPEGGARRGANGEVDGGMHEARMTEEHGAAGGRSRRRNAWRQREVSPEGGVATGAGERGAE